MHHPKARLLITEQYDGVIDEVLLGLGVTVVFARSVLRHLRAGELKVLLPDYDIQGIGVENNRVFLRYSHRAHLPYSVRVLADFLVDHFSSQEILHFDKHLYAA